MKRFGMTLAAAFLSVATASAGWKAGEGIANDRATGQNARDVTFVARGAGNGYGWRQYTLPVGLTVLPWSVPNFECFVYGLRINLGWGEYAETYGLDSGVFSDSKVFGGISANVFGNYREAESVGIDVGGVNIAGTMRGLQLGFVNFADRLCGVQLGVLNFNASGVTLPILNVGW